MYGKLVVLISALAFGNPARAGETSHAGHDHADHEKAAVSKAAPPVKIGAEIQDTKAAGKPGKCKPHMAAQADCFICDPALRDKGRLWCKEHARYEDRCFLCHPEIKEAKRLYCEQHGLYEDECFLCHPELKKAPKAGKPGTPGKANEVPAKSADPKKG